MPRTYIAWPSHPWLRQDIEQLIANLDARTKESQKALAARIFEKAAQEMMTVLVVNLVKRLENPKYPVPEIHRNIARVNDHLGGFCRLLTGLLSNDKISAAMHQYQHNLMTIPDADGKPQPWMGFRVDAAFVDELRAVATHLRDDSQPYDVARTLKMLDRLSDAVFHELAEVPKEKMNFGFVARKAADGALGLIKSAMHGMTHRSVPHLSPRQRKGLADHLESVLVDLPA